MAMTAGVDLIATRSTNLASPPVMLAPINEKFHQYVKKQPNWKPLRSNKNSNKIRKSIIILLILPISHLPKIKTFVGRAFHEGMLDLDSVLVLFLSGKREEKAKEGEFPDLGRFCWCWFAPLILKRESLPTPIILFKNPSSHYSYFFIVIKVQYNIILGFFLWLYKF